MANDINVVIGADIQQIKQALERIEKQTKKTTSSIGNSFSKLQSVIVGAFSLDKIKESLNFAAEFDDNLRITQSAAKLTAEEFEKLKQKALELGREPGQTPAVVAAGMAEAARAGQNFNEIMTSVAATARLAASSELDFGEATELTTDILAAFGLTAADNTRIVDVLVEGSGSASVKVSQLGESFKYASAISKSLGISVEQTTASLLVLANSGIKAEMGGTNLRGVWGQLIENSDELSARFNTQISTIENGKVTYRSLADIFDDLKKAGMQSADVFEIFGKRAGPGAAVFLEQGGDAIREYEQNLLSASGTSEEVVEIMQSGVGGAIRTIVSESQNAVLMFTDQFAPAIKLVAEYSYLFSAAMDGVVGVIKTAQQIQAKFISKGLSVLSYFGALTDAIGLTDDAQESLKTASEDFGFVSEQAANKSGEAFSNAYDEVTRTSLLQKELNKIITDTGNDYKKITEAVTDFGNTAKQETKEVIDHTEDIARILKDVNVGFENTTVSGRAMSEVVADISSKKQELKLLSDEIARITQDLKTKPGDNELENQLVLLETAQKKLKNELLVFEKEISATEESVAEIDDSVPEVVDNLEEINEPIEDIKENLLSAGDATTLFSEKVEELASKENQLKILEQRVSELKALMAKGYGGSEALSEFKDAEQNIVSLKSEISELTKEVDVLNDHSGNLTDTYNDVNSTIGQVSENVSNIANANKELSDSIDDISESVNNASKTSVYTTTSGKPASEMSDEELEVAIKAEQEVVKAIRQQNDRSRDQVNYTVNFGTTESSVSRKNRLEAQANETLSELNQEKLRRSNTNFNIDNSEKKGFNTDNNIDMKEFLSAMNNLTRTMNDSSVSIKESLRDFNVDVTVKDTTGNISSVTKEQKRVSRLTRLQ